MKRDSSNTVIVIVSAYSSGSQLAPFFKEKGYHCIHITTQREWKITRLRNYFHENDFIENIIISDEDSQSEFNEVIAYLKKFQVKLILPGCESGVRLADALSHSFDVPKNDYSLTTARRNKFLMIEAIKNCGLLHPRQFKSNDLHNILNWFRENSFSKVVLKPLASSSSDSVFYCHDENDIQQAFSAILNTRDMYNEVNFEVLIQEFIEGDEYIVNTVSRNGLHHVIDIWKGVSHDKSIVSNDSYADLIHPNMPAHTVLSDYVKLVLNALGIMNGAAHSEIKMSKNGACLIETGARLAGKVDFASVENIFGYSQLSLLVNGMLDFANFERVLLENPKPSKYARYVYFASNEEGLIQRDPDLGKLFSIQSLAFMSFLPKKGDQLRKTSKTFRSPRPGYAYLINQDMEKLEKDYLLLRRAEKSLYLSLL